MLKTRWRDNTAQHINMKWITRMLPSVMVVRFHKTECVSVECRVQAGIPPHHIAAGYLRRTGEIFSSHNTYQTQTEIYIRILIWNHSARGPPRYFCGFFRSCCCAKEFYAIPTDAMKLFDGLGPLSRPTFCVSFCVGKQFVKWSTSHVPSNTSLWVSRRYSYFQFSGELWGMNFSCGMYFLLYLHCMSRCM